jgi:hypothetical protein
MLVFLSLLLFFILLIFPLLHFGVRLPSSFSMQNDVAFGVHGVGYFGEAVVSAAWTEFYLILGDVDLLEAEVTFPDEPSDGGYDPTI